MKTDPLQSFFDVITPPHDAEVAARCTARVPATTTSEKGRHYPRSEVCAHCWRRFTIKGIKRHRRVCLQLQDARQKAGKGEPTAQNTNQLSVGGRPDSL